MKKLIDRAIPVAGNYWDRTLEERINFSSLDSDKKIQAEFVVVGGGPAGLSAAYTLRQFGADVILLEGKCIGLSIGNSTGIIDGTGYGEYSSFAEFLGKFGEKTADIFADNRKAYERLNSIIDEHEIKCNKVQEGQINFFKRDDKEFYSCIDALIKVGYAEGRDFSVFGTKDFNGHMCNGYFKYGIWIKYGMVLNPLSFAKGFARVCEENGAKIYEYSPVIEVVQKNGYVQIKTPNAILEAKKAIIATNPYTIDIDGLPKDVKNRIAPIFQTVAVSSPLPKNFTNSNVGWVVSGEDYPGLEYPFGRFNEYNGERRMLLGTGKIQPAYTSMPKICAKESDELFEKLFPGMNIRTEEIFGGFIGQTPDREGIEGYIAQNVFLSTVTDGINKAVENGRESALSLLEINRINTTPYRNGPLNTLYAKTPIVLKDFAASVYLLAVSLK